VREREREREREICTRTERAFHKVNSRKEIKENILTLGTFSQDCCPATALNMIRGIHILEARTDDNAMAGGQ